MYSIESGSTVKSMPVTSLSLVSSIDARSSVFSRYSGYTPPAMIFDFLEVLDALTVN